MIKHNRIVSLMIVLFILVSSKTISADINKTPAEMAIKSKMDSKILYVVEKEDYKEVLSKDVLVVEPKNNLLSIDTEDIGDYELDIIKSADSYFVLGKTKESVFPTRNLGGHILYEEDQSFINLTNINTEKNLIVTNEESMIDIVNATQIGNIENRNLLLIKDNRINNETKAFLSEYGNDKNILFVEGEFEISDEIKKHVLQIASGPKYKLNTFKISKVVEENKIDLLTLVLDKLPHGKSEQNEIAQNKTKDNINIGNVIDNSNKEIFNKIQQSSKNSLVKNSKLSEETILNQSKLISYEELIKEELYMTSSIKAHKFIDTLQKQEDNQLIIQSNEEIQDNKIVEKHMSIKLTYAEPLSIHNYVSDSKYVYVTSKSINNEIIYSVMEGDYGEGEERRERLEEEGYSYEEVQSEIQSIVNQRQQQIEQTNSRIAETNKVVYTPSSSLINSFLNEAFRMQGWDYSQENRWAVGQADCSSLVIRALINTGHTKDTSNMTTRTIMNDNRFYEISMNQIKKGDILWYPGHMEIYVGGNSTFGAFRPGKKVGYAGGINRFSRAFRISGS